MKRRVLHVKSTVGRTPLLHFPPKDREHSLRLCRHHQSSRANPLTAWTGGPLNMGRPAVDGCVRKSYRHSLRNYHQKSGIRSTFWYSKATPPSFASSAEEATDVWATCAVKTVALALTDLTGGGVPARATEQTNCPVPFTIPVPMAVSCLC